MAGDGVTKLQKFATEKFKPKKDDDAVDRLNYYWTSALLGFFALVIIGKQYVGQPIQCWIPAEFKGQWEKYAENYCFVENTYWVNFTEKFPTGDRLSHKDREVHYYQWVPFFFLAQMFLFIVPKLLWKLFVRRKNQLDLNALVELATLTTKVGKKKPERTASPVDVSNNIYGAFNYMDKRSHYIANHASGQVVTPITLEDLKHMRHATRRSLTFFYLGYKLLQLVNTGIQLFLLNQLLGPEYKLWGYGILKDLIDGRPWQHSGHFPRVTFCDLEIREMGDIFLQHTFQCVLMINMINEKLFIFLWWWLVILGGINIVNLLKWVYYAVYSPSAYNFINANLAFAVLKAKVEIRQNRLRQFVDDYLCLDGVTILRLIEANSASVVTSDIVYELWKAFDDAAEREEDGKEPEQQAKVKANGMCAEYGQGGVRAPE